MNRSAAADHAAGPLSALITGLALLVLGVGGLAAAPAAAQQDIAAAALGRYVIHPQNISVTFTVKQFGIANVNGRFKDVRGRFRLAGRNLSKSHVDVTVAAPSVSNINDDFEAFMKGPDLLDVKRFPTIRFRSTAVRRTGPTTARMRGRLTVRGITRPLDLAVTFARAGRDPRVGNRFVVTFTARGRFLRSAFGMTAARNLVSDEVDVAIRVTGVRG